MTDTSARENLDTRTRNPEWSRSAFIWISALAVAVATVSLFWQRQVGDVWRSVFGPAAVNTGTTHVFQLDYAYWPRHITWRVGDKVTISLHNQSPSHFHEMVIGRAFDNTPSAFGPIHTQFATDFWDGVHVTLSHATKVDNFAPNKAIVTYVGPKPNVAYGGDFSPTLQPGGHVDLTFIVPNKPGQWQYGCFVQQYVHYIAGMRGTISILPAKA